MAREFEVALPTELSTDERRKLALEFAKEMANREGCAVDVAIHAPGKEGDNRNHHAHILRTTRKVEAEGLGAKLDTEQAGRKRKDDLEQVRERWASLSNKALERAGHSVRIDHRSLKELGIDREPTVHLGPAASGYERRTGEPSDTRIRQELAANERLAKAKELGDLERQSREIDRSVIDLSGDLQAAKAERDCKPEVVQAAVSGMADFRAQFEQYKAIEAGKAQAREAFERHKLDQERKQAEKSHSIKPPKPERDRGWSR